MPPPPQENEEKKWTLQAGLLVFLVDFVLLEMLAPTSPTLIEWLMKYRWPSLGHFTFLEKPLAISAMMVPLVAFIRLDASQKISRLLFVSSIILGTAFFVASIIFDSTPYKTSNPTAAASDLLACYELSGYGLILTLVFLGLSSLWKNLLHPSR